MQLGPDFIEHYVLYHLVSSQLDVKSTRPQVKHDPNNNRNACPLPYVLRTSSLRDELT